MARERLTPSAVENFFCVEHAAKYARFEQQRWLSLGVMNSREGGQNGYSWRHDRACNTPVGALEPSSPRFQIVLR